MSHERPRFGLIGSGVWPRMVQAPAAGQSTAVHFTSVFGRDATKTEAFAEQFNIRAYADLAAFFDSVDIVGIALPPDAQAQYALSAARAGKPAILEKPLTLDSDEAEAIVTAFEERNLPTLVFFTNLLIPRTQTWLKEVAAAGRWIAARIETYSNVLNDTTNPFHGTVAAWRGDAGSLWDMGPHGVAMLLATLGDITQVVAVHGQGDLKLLAFTHASGAVSSMALAMDAPAGLPGETALFGSAGKAIAPESRDWFADSTEAYGIALRLIADAAAGKTVDMVADVRLGLKVTRVLAAAAQSIDTGSHINLSIQS